ncbi:dihydroorotate oxidase B, electron transfer subunit [Halobacillus alkaliphilus]|uniref:Dihydroorotate dehydrogenase B (NAD(+)), electron transfer subunit n=1 Tax=Halobacillus alkaliphilus TaxID=396056 RepID=A0A1I2Q6N5_9BACI|nr:dihydroorotate dehydrogenase electron transfer subunit [Halobacillus alkaliphilus]SFG23303.1 dihydroorotate oxidase B, electron transfer subunit [Halobacillus alkaliphilus]
MRREWMEIVDHSAVAKDTYRMVLKGQIAEEVEDPGQFVHIQVSDRFFLRRPVSIADVHPDKNEITLLYKVLGDGTQALTEKRTGDKLDVLGPGGQGFPIEKDVREALIVGGGIGVPPLYYLAKQLVEQGIKVTTVLGFRSKEEAFLIDEFKALGALYVTTDDGSLGEKGLVTDRTDELRGSFDTYFSCGPTVMLKAIANQLEDVRGYISMEERMGCGIGACFACVVHTPEDDEKGYRRVCCDGPVFKAKEVVL